MHGIKHLPSEHVTVKHLLDKQTDRHSSNTEHCTRWKHTLDGTAVHYTHSSIHTLPYSVGATFHST